MSPSLFHHFVLTKITKIQHIARRYWWPNRIEWSMRNGQNQRIQQAKTNTYANCYLSLLNDDVQVFTACCCFTAVRTHRSLFVSLLASIRKPAAPNKHRVWNCLFTSFYQPIHISPNKPIDTHTHTHVRHMCENNDQIVMNKRAIKVHTATLLLKSNFIFARAPCSLPDEFFYCCSFLP